MTLHVLRKMISISSPAVVLGFNVKTRRWVSGTLSMGKFIDAYCEGRRLRPQSKWLILIRHGYYRKDEQEWAPWRTSSLDRMGREQSDRLGVFLSQQPFRPEVFFSSTLARAFQTAKRVRAQLGIRQLPLELELFDETLSWRDFRGRDMNPFHRYLESGSSSTFAIVAHINVIQFFLARLLGMREQDAQSANRYGNILHSGFCVVELPVGLQNSASLWLWNATPHLPDDLRTDEVSSWDDF